MHPAMVQVLRHATLVLLMLGSLASASAHAQPVSDPDRLYDGREDLANAMAAADEWERRLTAQPGDAESAWKLARACYWLGGHAAPGDRRRQLERGIDAAQRAVTAAPQDPAGHFWLAANMGALAETAGMRAGLRYRGQIKRELETVLMLAPSFQKGSADRALGRWYYKVPRLFGGSTQKSFEHLQRSLSYDPGSVASLSFLADTLIEMDRRDEARQALQKVLAAPADAEWGPEIRDFQRQAAATLKRLR